MATPTHPEPDSPNSGSGGTGGPRPGNGCCPQPAGCSIERGSGRSGVERILTEAPATRATFYRHFPSKEDLVLAYLRGVDARIRTDVHAAIETAPSPADAVRAIGTAVADDLTKPEFRGCAFLKAAAEYPDPHDPVRRVVLDHRAWYVATLTELFTQVFGTSPRRGRPEHAAQHFLMMRDGAMTGADLDGVDSVGAAFHHGVEGLLTLLH
jgi:AcrR family transcriptional regulator